MPHVPGPWSEIERTSSYINIAGDPVDAHASNVPTAKPGEIAYVSVCRVLRHATGDANAKLIAAAPDLLEACKKAEAFIDAIMGFYGQNLEVANWHRNGDTEPFDNFIDNNSDNTELKALRDAIAKATT